MSLVITTTGTATLDPYLLINRLFHLFLILHYLLLAFIFGEFPATARDSCLACVSQYMSNWYSIDCYSPSIVWLYVNSLDCLLAWCFLSVGRSIRPLFIHFIIYYFEFLFLDSPRHGQGLMTCRCLSCSSMNLPCFNLFTVDCYRLSADTPT